MFQDVLILEQFVAKNGEMLPRRITGLCVKQHRLLKDCIDKSQKAGERLHVNFIYVKI